MICFLAATDVIFEDHDLVVDIRNTVQSGVRKASIDFFSDRQSKIASRIDISLAELLLLIVHERLRCIFKPSTCRRSIRTW